MKIWFFKIERVKRTDDPEDNALVADLDKGLGLEYVKPDECMGRRWRYGSDMVYLMKRDFSNVLTAILPQLKPTDSPEKLFRALYDSTAEILYSLESPLWTKGRLTGLYVVLGIGLFILFLLVPMLMDK